MFTRYVCIMQIFVDLLCPVHKLALENKLGPSDPSGTHKTPCESPFQLFFLTWLKKS